MILGELESGFPKVPVVKLGELESGSPSLPVVRLGELVSGSVVVTYIPERYVSCRVNMDQGLLPR